MVLGLLLLLLLLLLGFSFCFVFVCLFVLLLLLLLLLFCLFVCLFGCFVFFCCLVVWVLSKLLNWSAHWLFGARQYVSRIISFTVSKVQRLPLDKRAQEMLPLEEQQVTGRGYLTWESVERCCCVTPCIHRGYNLCC